MPLTRPALAISAAALLGATACVDPNMPNANARQGALIGAGFGALTGLATGDTAEERRRNAVLGAALGAGGGALIGQRLDRQEEALRQQIGDDRVQIVNTGEQLIVRMPNDILFPFDSARLTPTLQSDLRALAINLQQFPDTTAVIIGHTDNVGSEAYNLDLSTRRASSVASELIAGGVRPSRLRTVGRGEAVPIASNATPQGRAQNRRVEIVITPSV